MFIILINKLDKYIFKEYKIYIFNVIILINKYIKIYLTNIKFTF